ncbi:antibiotic biosynthesis monooxygenase [Shewanella sp. NIFS-20-20]|uniref:antibiotic biosynthesis monooxygenase family protein n=1 Tax=Shewanella sp. NIFS-20-20 TaxID=2853806 RepID=UPI001C4686D7|nr:hypothetical protein [Shewanella sp. NIFS-20-20]MBV7314541.1 hypothetical protein [Shewanella sp. NIFS-20-20]
MSDIYSATFIFSKKEYDQSFFDLDSRIVAIASQTPGYIGCDHVEDIQQNRLINIYYWQGRDGLEQLVHHPIHRQAKAQYQQWLDNYQVIIAKVEQVYQSQDHQHPLTPFTTTLGPR